MSVASSLWTQGALASARGSARHQLVNGNAPNEPHNADINIQHNNVNAKEEEKAPEEEKGTAGDDGSDGGSDGDDVDSNSSDDEEEEEELEDDAAP